MGSKIKLKNFSRDLVSISQLNKYAKESWLLFVCPAHPRDAESVDRLLVRGSDLSLTIKIIIPRLD